MAAVAMGISAGGDEHARHPSAAQLALDAEGATRRRLDLVAEIQASP